MFRVLVDWMIVTWIVTVLFSGLALAVFHANNLIGW